MYNVKTLRLIRSHANQIRSRFTSEDMDIAHSAQLLLDMLLEVSEEVQTQETQSPSPLPLSILKHSTRVRRLPRHLEDYQLSTRGCVGTR